MTACTVRRGGFAITRVHGDSIAPRSTKARKRDLEWSGPSDVTVTPGLMSASLRAGAMSIRLAPHGLRDAYQANHVRHWGARAGNTAFAAPRRVLHGQMRGNRAATGRYGPLLELGGGVLLGCIVLGSPEIAAWGCCTQTGTLSSSSGWRTTLSCSLGSVRAPTTTAGSVWLRLTAT